MSWEKFINTADEYLISYFCPPHSIGKAKLFLISHSVELYLKALFYKQTSNINKTMEYGHNIWSIWKKLKQNDSNFMVNWNFSERIYQIMKNKKNIDRFTKDEEDDYHLNKEFYTICVFEGDIKYLGVNLKRWKFGSYAVSNSTPNNYWVNFFKDLRIHLKFPTKEFDDIIPHTVKMEPICEPYSNNLLEIANAFNPDHNV
jgi:hypothetical protein